MVGHTVLALRRHRRLSLSLLDGAAWFAAVYAATALRLETFSTSPSRTLEAADGRIPLLGVAIVALFAALVHIAIGWTIKLHSGRSAVGSVEELLILGTVAAAAAVTTTLFNAWPEARGVPASVPVMAGLLTFFVTAWVRGLWRVAASGSRSTATGTARRTVIVGAGEGGRQLVSSMLNDPQHHWDPVAILDDDPHKKHFRFRGVSVEGTIADLPAVADAFSASTVVLAIPSADADLRSAVTSLALDHGLDVKVLPGVEQLLTGVSHRSVRDVEPSDLLDRLQVETDVETIAAYLSGRRVLVTGAGGSIGSELCRQIVRYSPAAVAFLDRDESALHSLALSIDGRADLESDHIVLADIRDPQRLEEIFSSFQPEIVFHSAALKHVNVLEHHASEALQTNVWGTLNLLDAAERHGVHRFVNISTDKAADPENVLGYSKRIAERLTAARAQRSAGSYLSVRFGNVFGTNGSVIKTFAAQIEAGGPVTVTDPQVTRYFMTVHEAVQLVVQAAAIGRGGEALVLDMGDPVNILDVAQRMIALSHDDIRIVFTGLKPGEKLHECLFGSEEVGTPAVHPLISHVEVPVLDVHDVTSVDRSAPNEKLTEALRDLALSDSRVGQRLS